jgi:CubicO group peptidase (beta-lactamase class C family)
MPSGVAAVVTERQFPELMKSMELNLLGVEGATCTPSVDLPARMPVSYEDTKSGMRPHEGTGLGTAINPGGSLVSTLEDVPRLLPLHRNRSRIGTHQFLPADLLKQMYKPQPSTPGVRYDLGFNIMRRKNDGTVAHIRHAGGSGILGVIDFKRDLVIIVLTQLPQQQTLCWPNALVQKINDVFPRSVKSE